MTLWLRVSLWMGVIALHAGFAGVTGVLLRRACRPLARPQDAALAIAHTSLLFIPSCIMVLRLSDWPFVVQLGVALIGLLTVWLAALQPRWTPATLWRRSFGHVYFAGAMALAAVWGLGLSSSGASLPSTLVGTAACVASAASLITTPRSA
jgi:hypothetical protein